MLRLTVSEYTPLPTLKSGPETCVPAKLVMPCVGGVVDVKILPVADNAPVRKSPGSVILTFIVTRLPGSADVGVEGSTAPETSPILTVAFAVEPLLIDMPVALPLRSTAGKMPSFVKAMALTRYGPPAGTPNGRVTGLIPTGKS